MGCGEKREQSYNKEYWGVIMANIKLKDKNGTDVVYSDISTLTVPTDEDLTATFYETAPSNLQEKSVDIITNGSSTILPDEGYDGISKVNVTTYVPPTFTTYKFLSPITMPVKGTETQEQLLTAGGTVKDDAIYGDIRFKDGSNIPLVVFLYLGGHSAFQITPEPAENYGAVFYSWQELSAEQATGYGIQLAAGVTIPGGWSVGTTSETNITGCTAFTASASTVQIADNANISNDFFSKLFLINAASDTIVDLQMSNGNQVILPAAGEYFSKVTVKKPTTLSPENIKKDVDIGGVVGILAEGGSGGNANYTDYVSENGIVTVPYDLFASVVGGASSTSSSLLETGQACILAGVQLGANTIWFATEVWSREDNPLTGATLVYTSAKFSSEGTIVFDNNSVSYFVLRADADTNKTAFSVSVLKAVSQGSDITTVVSAAQTTLRIYQAI